MQKKAKPPLDLSRELQFLIICSQTNPTKEEIRHIQKTIQDPTFNIQDLISLASSHGILPLVYKTLKSLSSNQKSPLTTHKIMPILKQYYLKIVQRNMLMSSELIRIMNLLKENTFSSLSFKGPILSQMAYGDITLRQYSDLDILIKKDDILKISTLLKSIGYESIHMLTEIQEKNWYKYAKDINLFHQKKGIYIELHWQLLENDYPIQIDLNTIWKTQKTIIIHRQEILTFANESLLIYLCIHGSKHLWERIEWIKDIDLMIRTQVIDWEYIDTYAKESDFKRMLLLGFYLSHTLFHTPLPLHFKNQMYDQKWLMRLNDFVINDWSEHRNMFYNSVAMIDLFATTKMKLLYLHKVILKPSKNEYNFINLPKGLYWGYYLIRPYLLLRKYLTKS